jgi:molybdenum cofactor cytidylyltransferase
MPNIPILILASGPGSRFQGIKQLEHIEGVPMIKRVIHSAMRARGGEVVVILGAHLLEVEEAISGLQVSIVRNHDWEKGMSESIKAGVEYVELNFPKANALMVVLGDQPYIETADFNKLISRFVEHPDRIVCASYEDLRGVPAIFPRAHWEGLKSLSGDTGAKAILRSSEDVLTVDLPMAGNDVDRGADIL